MSRDHPFSFLTVALLPVIAACAAPAPPAQIDFTELPGTIELNQTSSDVPLGGAGRGTLLFHKQLYSFAIGGLGIYGGALSVIQTEGEAYRLKDISMFPGTYRQAPATVQPPGQAAAGLWLQNEHGALIRFLTPPGGKLPDIDGDAVRITLE